MLNSEEEVTKGNLINCVKKGEMNQKTGICSDFKSVLEGIKRNDRNNNTSYSEKYKSLIPFSFAYKVVCIDDKFNKPVILNRRKKAVNKFIEAILKEMNYCKKVIK